MVGADSVGISVVLPTYDEAQNIGPLITRLLQILGQLRDPAGASLSCEIIVIDAGSTDGTLARAREAGATRVFVQKERGYGMALKEGFASACGRYIITMDADLSHDPLLLPAMMARMADADVVIASRYVEGGSSDSSAFRRILSVILNRIYTLVLWLPIRDCSSGYRIYDRRVLDHIEITCRNFDALEEILMRAWRNGARIVEVPMNYRRRAHGASHARLLPFALSYAKTLVKMFFLRFL
jgi:dolichol-phosphate mannosyltransferase